MLRYTVFRTRWGYFSLSGTEQAVRRTFLPVPDREQARHGLLHGCASIGDNLSLDKDFQKDLQERIVAYYEGEPVDFTVEPAVHLNGASAFVHQVLRACRSIAFGTTKTYSDLAREVGHPGAARAVGRVMAGNPIPLIIPCHRVLRTDG
ncbi:MAG: methylated-DNA--[protein]-cysteine S-methyltransferase, partial [Planctomycetes bacterium]|nr:methylated-DNA--[protein]-cysteine S-methyltransferase [Planctomycetota bacterium]